MGAVSHIFACCLLLLNFGLTQAASRGADYVINTSAPLRVWDGIGGLSAAASSRLLYDYPEPARSNVLDLMFVPRFAMSYQILKVEIGGDCQDSGWGTEPSHRHTSEDVGWDRGYEWWLMREAKQRNPDIPIAVLSWCIPGWIENGTMSAGNMEYQLSFLRGARDVHNITVDYAGVMNEQGWTSDYIKSFRAALNAAGFASTKLVAADSAFSWSIAEAMAKDSALNASVDIVGVHHMHHLPNITQSLLPPASVRNLGKTLWSSEEGLPGIDGVPGDAFPNWAGSANWMRVLTSNLWARSLTANILCPLVNSWMPQIGETNHGFLFAREPWSGAFQVGAGVWLTAHFTQFVDRGWWYLGGGPLQADDTAADNGSYVMFTPAKGSSVFAVVIETTTARVAQKVRFQLLSSDRNSAEVYVWRSTNRSGMDDYFVQQPSIHLSSEGVVEVELLEGAVYTLTNAAPRGQRRGSYRSPRQLPLFWDSHGRVIYRSNFSSIPVQQPARGWSDFYGSFEVAPEGVLRQSAKVVPEGTSDYLNGFPLTLFGVNLMNFQLRADVCAEGLGGVVRLCGRISRIHGAFESGNWVLPPGICLSLNNSGAWSLAGVHDPKHPVPLGNGSLPSVPPQTWRSVTMTFADYTVTVTLGGERLVQAELDALVVTGGTNGIIGLGSGWHGADFDNVVVAATRAVHKTSFLHDVWIGAHSPYNPRVSARQWFGFMLDVKQPIVVSALGRYFCQGNRQVHQLAILQRGTSGQPCANRTSWCTQVDAAVDSADVLGFIYGALNDEVVLHPGERYYVVALEDPTLDVWYTLSDPGWMTTSGYGSLLSYDRSAATVAGRVAFTEGEWSEHEEVDTMYGPLNLLWTSKEQTSLASDSPMQRESGHQDPLVSFV